MKAPPQSPREVALLDAGVLDGSRSDDARLAFLDIYASAKPPLDTHASAPDRWNKVFGERLRAEVWFALDPVMRGTRRQAGVKYAERLAGWRRARTSPPTTASPRRPR